MAASFFIRTTKSKGLVTLFVRLQSVKQKINHKAATPLQVDIKAWNNSKKGSVQMDNFRKSNPEVAKKMDEIKSVLEATLSRPDGITQKEFTDIIDEVMYRKIDNEIKRNPQKTDEIGLTL